MPLIILKKESDKMLLLGTKNFTTQDVIANGILNLGAVYRRYCKRINGVRTFDFDGNNVILQQSGIYHITVTATVSGAEAGDVTLALYENGIAIPGVVATETITTPDTEFRDLTLDYYVLVDSACVLGNVATVQKAITLVNTGIEATYTNVTVNVDKVV